MASIIPKIRLFIFISVISLLINLSACCVALASEETKLDNYSQMTEEGIQTTGGKPGQSNVSANDFVVATATSFLPFVDLVNLALLMKSLDVVTLLILGLITALLGALKLLLIASLVANFIPFENV